MLLSYISIKPAHGILNKIINGLINNIKSFIEYCSRRAISWLLILEKKLYWLQKYSCLLKKQFNVFSNHENTVLFKSSSFWFITFITFEAGNKNSPIVNKEYFLLYSKTKNDCPV